mgnify:CR=1 FL=1
MNSLRKILTFRSANTLWVFIALIFVFSLFTPNKIFINVRNISAIGKLFPDLGIITLGVGMLMICGEFDLSVASVLPFCSCICTSAFYRYQSYNQFYRCYFSRHGFRVFKWIYYGKNPDAFIYYDLGYSVVLERYTLCLVKNDAYEYTDLCSQ